MDWPCPTCRRDSRVLETRHVAGGCTLRRRRICDRGHRFSTWETAEVEFVVKRDLRVEPFDEWKLRRGVAKAADVPEDAPFIQELVDETRARIKASAELRREPLSTTEIGEDVLEALLRFDEKGIAHSRFSSIFLKYDRHQSVDELNAAIARQREGTRLYVLKSDGQSRSGLDGLPDIEPFSPSKLREALRRALNKIGTAGDVDRLVQEIRKTALEKARRDVPEGWPSPLVASNVIGDDALERLRQISPLAFARFASVYRNYDRFEDFVRDMARAGGADASGSEHAPGQA